MNDSKAYIFYGAGGSGKGTQAKLLIEKLEKKNSKKVLYVETGQRFRDFFATKNHTSSLVKEVLDSGKLLPPFLPIWTWTQFFIDNFTGKEDLVLDGLCRRPDEAPVLDSALKFYGVKDPVVVVLNVSRESLVKRLESRGRHDDSLDFINRRLDWYEQEVVPTISYFRQNSDYDVIDIDAEKSIEDVHCEIIEKLGL